MSAKEKNADDCIDVGIVVQDYEKFVKGLFKTNNEAPYPNSFIWNLTHAALGIGGEADEVVDLVKKTFANNRTLDGDKLVKELGDLMFYIQAMCNTINIPLITVLQANVVKLTARFPEGYSNEAAIARADENQPEPEPESEVYGEIPRGYKMSTKSLGKPFKNFMDAGWTREQMVEFGYIELIIPELAG
jgi:NTP pyrophosphatase (non-canonical NTP hydrolase)